MKETSLVVLGKTFAATGGTIGLVLSLTYWGLSSGQLSTSEMVYLSSIAVGSLLGTASWFIPKVSIRVQSVISLIGVLLILLGCDAYGIFQDSSYAVFVWGSIITITGAGTLLVLFAMETTGNAVQN